MRKSKLIGFQILLVMMISCNSTPKYTQDVNMEYVPEYPNMVAVDIEPERIYKMKVSRARLNSLTEQLVKLTNLNKFVITRSSIENCNASIEVISSFKYLNELEFSGMDLDSLLFNPLKNSKLESLDLIALQNYSLEKELPNIQKLPNLKFLNIGGLKISRLPESFSDLNNIERLDFGNHNKEFNYNYAIRLISYVNSLKYLKFDLVSLNPLPPNFSLLSQLNGFGFYNCDIDLNTFFNKISSFNNVEELIFKKMDITEFPEKLTEINSLQKFLLYKIPNLNHPKLFKQLAQLPNLEELDLSATISSEIHTDFCFPPELAELKRLKKLDISSNQQLVFDTLFDLLSQLPNLEKLRMHDIYGTTNIVQFPDKLKDLTSLKELDISYNGPHPLELVTELPESLEKLDYSMSRFNDDTPLQKVVFTVKNLKSLNLSDNLLKELPEEIGNLKNLVHLDLSYNQIRELPESIMQCKKLKYLNLMYTYIAKDKAKRAAIEEMLPNTLIFFGEYEVWDPENH